MTRRLFLLVTTALLASPAAHAEDWPQFRGPTGQGHVRGKLPTHWSPTQNVAWKQAIPGTGWSSPIVWKGRVYLTTAVPAKGGGKGDQSLQALCLDAKTGDILWKKEVFSQVGSKAPAIHGKNSHASPTPVTDGERLYVHFGHQGTACLDLQGKVLWRNTRLRYQPVHGNGGSPVLVEDALVFSIDASDQQALVALDRKKGDVLWKTDRKSTAAKKFSFSTPLVITVKGHKQIVSPGSNVVTAHDPKSGKEIWRVRYSGYSVIPRPVFAHGLLFVSSSFDSPRLLAIRPDGKGDVTDTHIAWQTGRAAPCTPSPIVVKDELYMVSDNGVASCLDARTGKVHWTQRLGGGYSASPLYADGKVYFQNEDGVGTVIKAGKKFERVAKNDMDERTLASYAAADGALFLRTKEHLYCIREKADSAE